LANGCASNLRKAIIMVKQELRDVIVILPRITGSVL
jgi:hypothetical protein